MIRVALPQHLRTLAGIDGEIAVAVAGEGTLGAVLDAVEAAHPALAGTIRDHRSHRRRDFIRFFACGRDLSHQSPDAVLPDPVRTGDEPLRVVGALAGG